jgi:hypothetical protein
MRALLWRRLAAGLIVMIALAGCAGLGGEPEIVATVPPFVPTAIPELPADAEGDADTEQEAAPPIAAAAEVAATTGTFSGVVHNASADEIAPADLQVLLYVLDDRFDEQVLQTRTDADGRYRFEDVPVRRGWHYLVSVQYGGGYFAGNMVAGTPDAPDVELPVTVYDVTADPAAITISSVLAQVTPVEGGLRVIQIFQFRNDTRWLYVTEQPVDDAHNVSIAVRLPAGAQVLAFDDQRRYVLSADGETVISLEPVFPGERHMMHISYLLPYSGPLTVEQPLDYRLDGPVEMVAPDALVVETAQLTASGAEIIEGTRFVTYAGDLSLPAGDALRYQVSGGVVTGSTTSSPPGGTLLATVGGAALGMMLVAGGWFYLRRREPQGATHAVDERHQIDELVAGIAELDRLYQAGQIDAAAYQAERGQLKARLADLMRPGA